jgi:hypothetical protein
LSAAGTITANVALAGLSSYGQLVVSGTATLNGTLNVSTIGG